MKKIFDWMITYYLLAALLCLGMVDIKRAYKFRLQRNDPWAMCPIEHSENPSLVNDFATLRQGLRYYKILLCLVPEASQAYGMAGYCYFYLHKNKKAIQAFSEAVKKEPNFY